MPLRQCLEHCHRQRRLRLTPHTHHPQCRHRQHQPQPLRSRHTRHFRRLPLPASSFAILVSTFDPRSQPVPCHIRCTLGEIGHYQPRLTIPHVPARQQCTHQ